MTKRLYLRIQNKLNKMGLELNANIFIYMRLASCILLFVLTFFSNSYGYIIAPLTTIIYYIFVEYIILDLGIKNHATELEEQAIDFFPLFLIHLKGTRNVKKALYFTTSLVQNDLSYAFTKVLKNVEIGTSLEEALTDLKSKMPSDAINNIITTILEINRVGVNSEEAINLQLEYIENKRCHRVINRLRLIPLRIALISVLFVFLILTFLIFLKMYLI